jgi:hypothetical protein
MKTGSFPTGKRGSFSAGSPCIISAQRNFSGAARNKQETITINPRELPEGGSSKSWLKVFLL